MIKSPYYDSSRIKGGMFLDTKSVPNGVEVLMSDCSAGLIKEHLISVFLNK